MRVLGTEVKEIRIGAALQQKTNDLDLPELRRGGQWRLPFILQVPAPMRWRIGINAKAQTKSHARHIAKQRIAVKRVGIRPPQPKRQSDERGNADACDGGYDKEDASFASHEGE